MASHGPIVVEFKSSHVCTTTLPAAKDLFRDSALVNSHNHHGLHPWGEAVSAGTKEFDALYAEANNRYMSHLWYSPKLAPYMATEVLSITLTSHELLDLLYVVLDTLLHLGLDAALQSPDGKAVLEAINVFWTKLSSHQTTKSLSVLAPPLRRTALR